MDLAEKKLTIAEVAEYLGVSKSTVSRAISGKGRISEETRERVKLYIDRMDYKPNVIAKGLAQSKTYNIAVVLPVNCDFTELPFFQNCMCGVCEAAAKREYDVLTIYAEAGDITGLERIVLHHKVDGVILTRTLIEDAAAEYLKKRKMPVVTVGSSPDDSLIQVDHDHRSACRELTLHLLHSGIRKPGLIGGNESHIVTRSRYEGFADAHRVMGLPVDRNRVYFGVEQAADVEQTVKDLLRQETECIVCMDDMICNHVIKTIAGRKECFEKTIKIASFYQGATNVLSEQGVETIEFDARKLGAVAGNTLIDVIEGREMAGKQLLPYKLRVFEKTEKNS